MNSYEQFYVELYYCDNRQIPEQNVGEHNPLLQLIHGLQRRHIYT
jgi:hypothetical protein